jgi:hypothetical protein
MYILIIKKLNIILYSINIFIIYKKINMSNRDNNYNNDDNDDKKLIKK